MYSPAVNSEIWHFLERNIKSRDLGLQTVQKLLGHGIVPIIRMAEELKNKSPDSKVLKKCISDSMTVLLNTYFEMSVNRRLLMKPRIDRRYHQLCNRNEDIGESKLFADVGKRLKDIQDAQRINRNHMSKNSMRGRSFPTFRQQMRGYPRRGQWSNRGRGNTSNLQKFSNQRGRRNFYN